MIGPRRLCPSFKHNVLHCIWLPQHEHWKMVGPHRVDEFRGGGGIAAETAEGLLCQLHHLVMVDGTRCRDHLTMHCKNGY